MLVLRREAIESISASLSIPFTGIEQDWEIEFANSNRISDYLSFYKDNTLTSDERMALMALIIASYEEYLIKNNLIKDKYWDEISSLLRSDIIFFNSLIEYWCLSGEDEHEEYFKITNLVRAIKDSDC